MKNDLLWRPSTIESIWRRWLAPLKYLEPSLIMTYPGSDVSRRASQLFANHTFIEQELKIKNVEIVVVDYRTQKWSNGAELRQSIGSKSETTKIVWIFGFEEILRDKRSDLIVEMLGIYRESTQRLVLVCEANYYDKSFEQLLYSLPSFEPKIILHPSYPSTQLKEFVDYLATKWEMDLAQDVRDQICTLVGSNLRLIKSVMWYLRDKSEATLTEAIESEQVLWQVRAFWQKLSENEKWVILSDVYGLKMSEELVMSQKYINSMGLLTFPPLKHFVSKYVGNPMEIHIDQDQLLIGGKNYTAHFTRVQKNILKQLLANPGECVERAALIDAVWSQTPESGSDWALDSQINRLRQRLDEVGIGRRQLVTMRGKGLLWQLR